MPTPDTIIGMRLINYDQLVWLAAFILTSATFSVLAYKKKSVIATSASVLFGVCALHRFLAFTVPALMACQPVAEGCLLPEPYDAILRVSWSYHASLFLIASLIAFIYALRANHATYKA